MQQKIKFMRLLVIGILSSLVSCSTQVDGWYVSEYNLVNKTGSDVFIESFLFNTGRTGNDTIFRNVYTIRNDSVLIQQIELFFGNITGIVALSDSLSITLGENYNVQFLPYDTVSPFNILNSSNYEIERVSDSYEKLTYTFTEDDVSNALKK